VHRFEASQLREDLSPVSDKIPPINYKTVFLAMHNNLHNLEIEIPACRASYEGKLGTVSYTLDMRAITPRGYSSSEINISIKVYREKSHSSGGWLPPLSLFVPNQQKKLLQNNKDTSPAGLLDLLAHASKWNEFSLLKTWLSYGNINELTPEVVGKLFAGIKCEHSYYTFPNCIGEAMRKQVTVQHISHAAIAVPGSFNITICRAFAPYCVDKEYAEVEFAKIGFSAEMLKAVLTCYDS
jgi:hypothetical protein